MLTTDGNPLKFPGANIFNIDANEGLWFHTTKKGVGLTDFWGRGF